MIVRCLGAWAEDFSHSPAVIGRKEPLDDQRISDGCCDRCCRAMGVPLMCRWCEKAETANGLCTDCVKLLGTKMGPPTLQLTVYRAEAEPVSGSYDGAGAMLRLGNAMRNPTYCGFELRTLSPMPAGAL